VVELGRHSGSGAHGGVGSGADDDTVPGFGGGSSEVLELSSGGGGFGGGAGIGSGLVPNPGGRQNGSLMSWAAAMDGQGPCGGRQAHDRAYRQGGGDGADRGNIGHRQRWAFGRIWGRWNGPSGACRGGRY